MDLKRKVIEVAMLKKRYEEIMKKIVQNTTAKEYLKTMLSSSSQSSHNDIMKVLLELAGKYLFSYIFVHCESNIVLTKLSNFLLNKLR